MSEQTLIVDQLGTQRQVPAGRPGNGRYHLAAPNWQEVGTPGIEAWAGIVQQAYNAELYWPQVAPLYNRIWRSDPEASVARVIQESMASKLTVEFVQNPEIDEPTEDDQRALDFGNQVLADLEGGISKWFTSCMARVPFFGWGWWEAVPGLRKEGWRPPGEDDPWRSSYDDGLVGYRRLAFRHYSSFFAWDMDDRTGRLRGMMQNDPPSPVITIPLERSLHVTFGDSDNPEGLATLEAMWRLERYKYNLELIQGIGFEHSAGHFKATTEGELSDNDLGIIRKAARAVMTAQEGNYIALPNKIQGDIMDVNFQSAESLLDAVRYYGILKLALLGMQWAALGTLSPYGSYSSIKDANEFYLAIFNSMAEGFVNQGDEQIGRRLFENPANAAAFPMMTARPVLSVSRAQKVVDLADLGSFIAGMTAANMALGDEDWIAIRKKSDFLPETLPVFADKPEPKEPADQGDQEGQDGMDMPAGESNMFSLELRLLSNLADARSDRQAPDYSDGVMVCLYVPAEASPGRGRGVAGGRAPPDAGLSRISKGHAGGPGSIGAVAIKSGANDAAGQGPALRFGPLRESRYSGRPARDLCQL